MVSLLIALCLMANTLTPVNLNPLELFAARYMSHFMTKPVAPMHRQWYKELNDSSVQYLAIDAARGTAKTTLGSIIFALFNICEGNDPEFHVISRAGGSTGTATKIMATVRRELETNIVMIEDYGLKKGSKWLDDHVQVIRGDGFLVDFYSRGKRGSIRGARGTVLVDDPQNADDCESEVVLARDEEWLLTDVLPVLLDDQRLIFIGTPISSISLLSKVKDLPGFKSITCPIEDPVGSGKSAWPEQYPDKMLAQRKAMMGVDRYNGEYNCMPAVSGNPVFKPEWFKDYEPDSVQFERLQREGFFVVTGFDGAESKSTQADYTAIITLGATYGEKPDVYVLDARRHHWTTKEGAEQLFRVFNEQKQNVSVVESRCKPPNKDAIIEEITDRERVYSQFVNLRQVKPSTDKVQRAHYIQSFLQEGQVHFDRSDPGQALLISEMTMFTGSQKFHDDMVDAFVYALTEIKDRAGRNVDNDGPQIILPGTPSKYTGVV